MTALSTIGCGDITLVGTGGKLLAVAIMIFGISLFLRLVQVVLHSAQAQFLRMGWIGRPGRLGN
jgi:voltage-gated potassium channel